VAALSLWGQVFFVPCGLRYNRVGRAYACASEFSCVLLRPLASWGCRELLFVCLFVVVQVVCVQNVCLVAVRDSHNIYFFKQQI
jgi:hypothetical protein